MAHPNIVSTYTYTIKPTAPTGADLAKGAPAGALGEFSIGANRRASGGGGANGAPAATADGAARSGASSVVQAFEVCLVLEYCELGTLRDALDAGAFRMPDGYSGGGGGNSGHGFAGLAALGRGGGGGGSAHGGSAHGAVGAVGAIDGPAVVLGGRGGGAVNYAAVLDTAADVARAMVHLHRQNVIHSDLKVRNVLLKADGGSARGAVAKVGDFGLSVRLETHATHVSEFQGTGEPPGGRAGGRARARAHPALRGSRRQGGGVHWRG